MEQSRLWMARAIELSRRGWPAPNPRVGCVIVKEGRIVGEGWHDQAGGPHAEAAALADAGSEAKGAHAYATLEPCAHFGRTPPCSLALIQAGVAAVDFAVPDPNPKAQGGAAQLREAGIAVESGLLRAEAEAANAVFLLAHRRQSPALWLKAASTLDGFAARTDGSSQWITGPEAREAGHRLRAELGAVLVGAGTVLADDPRLDARPAGARRETLRIVLDPDRRLKGTEQVFRGGPEEWIWAVEEGRAESPDQLSAPRDGLAEAALQEAFRRGWAGVLAEGGPAVLRSLLSRAERLDLFLAAKWFGSGRAWWGGEEGGLGDGWRLREAEALGSDLHAVWVRDLDSGPDGNFQARRAF